MASNLMNVNLYIEIERCIAQLGTQVRRLGTQVRGNILGVSISGAALSYSAVWIKTMQKCLYPRETPLLRDLD